MSASPTPVTPASAGPDPVDDDRNNPELRRLTGLCGLDRRFVHGEGAWLTDDSGRRFLDAYAQYGAVVLGHNAPAVREAVEARAARPRARDGAAARGGPGGGARARARGRGAGRGRGAASFGTSGAEAVEAAIKLVRARSGRTVILSAAGSFHGRTLGALAATGQPHHREGFGPMPPGFETVPFGDADALAYRLERDGERIAAFFVEPVQGEGGVHVPPADYLARVRTLCDRHGVALVVDEIQTGLGRTGPLFAVAGAGVAPDVLLLAKGLGGGLFPLSACLVADAWWSPRFALGHSSTFASNNVACAAGLAVLRALSAPHAGAPSLLAHAAAVGAHLGDGLRRLQRRFPELVRDVRGRGLLCGPRARGARGPGRPAARLPRTPGALRVRGRGGARGDGVGADAADAGDAPRAAHRAAARLRPRAGGRGRGRARGPLRPAPRAGGRDAPARDGLDRVRGRSGRRARRVRRAAPGGAARRRWSASAGAAAGRSSCTTRARATCARPTRPSTRCRTTSSGASATAPRSCRRGSCWRHRRSSRPRRARRWRAGSSACPGCPSTCAGADASAPGRRSATRSTSRTAWARTWSGSAGSRRRSAIAAGTSCGAGRRSRPATC